MTMKEDTVAAKQYAYVCVCVCGGGKVYYIHARQPADREVHCGGAWLTHSRKNKKKAKATEAVTNVATNVMCSHCN